MSQSHSGLFDDEKATLEKEFKGEMKRYKFLLSSIATLLECKGGKEEFEKKFSSYKKMLDDSYGKILKLLKHREYGCYLSFILLIHPDKKLVTFDSKAWADLATQSKEHAVKIFYHLRESDVTDYVYTKGKENHLISVLKKMIELYADRFDAKAWNMIAIMHEDYKDIIHTSPQTMKILGIQSPKAA